MVSTVLPQLPVHDIGVALLPVVAPVPLVVPVLLPPLMLLPPPHAATNNVKQHPTSSDSLRTPGRECLEI